MSLFGAREGAFRGSGSALKDGLTFYWSELVSRGCGLCQCAWYREASGFPLSWSASLAEVGLLLCTRPPRTKRGCDELARIAGLRSNTQYSNVNLLKTASIWVLSSKFVCFFSLNEMKVRFLFSCLLVVVISLCLFIIPKIGKILISYRMSKIPYFRVFPVFVGSMIRAVVAILCVTFRW